MFLPSSVVRRARLLLALPLALLLASICLAAARAQEPAPPVQEPSPTRTPTPTPPPTPSPSPTPTPEEAEQVERIETNITGVLLSATDRKRRFVTTLRAEDLRLTEDGVEQKIETFEQETDAPLSLALLVDVSSSQAGVLPAEQEAASGFIRSILRPAKDTAAVLSFTGVTRLEHLPTGDPARLLAAINAIKVPYSAK